MKKGRIKYYIIINTLLILILSIIVFLVVLKLNNISVKSFVSDLFQQNDSDNIVDNKETEESTEEETKEEETEEETEPETEVVEDVYDTITISAAGDVTLGRILSMVILDLLIMNLNYKTMIILISLEMLRMFLKQMILR